MKGADNKLIRLFNYSLPMGRWLMGIPVELHWTILLVPILLFVEMSNLWTGFPLWKLAIASAVITAVMWVFIYLHECGHAFAFRQYDLKVSKITLGPLGGLCWGSRERSPREEIVVTIFGPLVNLCFTVLFLAILFSWEYARGDQFKIYPLTLEYPTFRSFAMEALSLMFFINFIQAAFNLICPIFPMDCAALLRATLCKWYAPARATRIVLTLGLVVGFVVILLGVYEVSQGATSGMLLIAIVLSLWSAARQEKERIKYEPVYAAAASPYASGWREMEDDPEDWKTKDEPKKSPGLLARWVARQEQRRQEAATQKAEDTRRRVDQLLEQISKQGMDSLSKKDRDFLSSASKSFRNRVS